MQFREDIQRSFQAEWTGVGGQPSPALTLTPRTITIAATVLVYVSSLYLFALCLINAHVTRIGDAVIVGCEIVIALMAIPILFKRLDPRFFILIVCVCLNAAVLALIDQSTDLKPLRDLLFPVVFMWLGYIVNDRHQSERVLRHLAALAIVVGLVEFIFPGFYTNLFDVLSFFKERGFGSTNRYTLQVLQTRPEGIGRSLLPFLGPRRISSIFLEPVSLGNFAVVVGAWAVSKPRSEWREALVLLVMALVLIVMADARFGSATLVALALCRVSGIWRLRSLTIVMPLIAMAATIVLALVLPNGHQDNAIGRFQVSGDNLIDMPWFAWLGIPATISLDAGYGYVIQRSGLILCIALWSTYCFLKVKSAQGQFFHFAMAIYICLNLCISGSSLFALKTVAILGFVLGSIIDHQKNDFLSERIQ